MVDQLVNTILARAKDQYPGIEHPAAMRAMITSATQLPKVYYTDCKISCQETKEEYTCRIERHYYAYTAKVLNNDGGIAEEYPELINIESRQQLQAGDVVQVVFLGNALDAAIVGG